ncbi:hypothetical protein LEN26_021227 [Aphanomyces euteiches]|nr:hypothetical protein LEN26_021227 [Aphanomyces euteiches]KAH9114355.1 hypothetical protein AeMF1_011558 [Aphanomyces euteiches]KAH9196380.1 hypothetical protein AeNC1_001637 [Aphanomyces euteiches]
MAKGASRGGGGANNAKEMKMFLKNRMWKEHWQVLVGSVVVIIALFAWIFLQAANSKQVLHHIQLTNSNDVDRVFRSGEPWLVLCSNADAVLPEVFDKASKRVVGKINVGVLDCHDKLPSGKSVYNKFLLREDISPTVFTIANGEKPKQLFLNYLQKPKILATQALEQVKKTLHEVQNTKQLDDKCLGKKSSCVLVYRTGKKFNDYEKQWLQSIMENHRQTAFVWMDASILSLSVESLFKKAATQGQNCLVLFKKVKGNGNAAPSTVAKAYTSYFEQLPVESFIDEFGGVSTDESAFRPLTKSVTITRRPKPTPKPTAKPAQTKPSPANAQPTETRTPQEIAEIERQRRERMEEESKSHYPEYVDEDEIDTTTATEAGEDEDDSEVLDLDEL